MFAQRRSRNYAAGSSPEMGMPSPGAVPPALYDPSWMQAAVGAHLMMQNAAARAEMAALHHGHHPYPPPWSAMGAFPPVDFMPPNELLLPGGNAPPGLQLGSSSSSYLPERSSSSTGFAGGDPMKVTLPEDLELEIQEPEAPRRRRSQKARRAAAAAVAANAPVPAVSRLVGTRGSLLSNSETDDDIQPVVDDNPLSAKFGTPVVLCIEEGACAELIQAVVDGSPEERHEIISWLLPYMHPLSLSKHGTHIVQKMLESAQMADKERITAELKPFTRELYESAHGNHVLAKVVQQLPSATVLFVVREFLGSVREVARHQYGCRILERLIEHCEDSGDMANLIDELVSDSESLCRHPFGNFVVQHLLEHGSLERRRGINDQVAHKLPALAMHRTASHFVQQLVSYSEPATQEQIVRSLLHPEVVAVSDEKIQEPHSFLEIAGSRHGSTVVEQLAGIESTYSEVRNELIQVVPLLTAAQLKFAQKVVDKFDLKSVVNLAPSSPPPN